MSQKRSAVKAPGVLAFSVLLILTAFDAPAQEDGGSRHTDVFHSAAAVFVPNRGQSDPRVQFYAQTRGASVVCHSEADTTLAAFELYAQDDGGVVFYRAPIEDLGSRNGTFVNGRRVTGLIE